VPTLTSYRSSGCFQLGSSSRMRVSYASPGPIQPAIVLAFSANASGGISVSGSASGLLGLSVAGTGGVVSSGLASTSFGFIVSATGGLQASGLSSYLFDASVSSVGGLTTGGSSSTLFGIIANSSGGVQVSGSSNAILGLAYSTTGGLTTGGSSSYFATFIANSSGGVQVSGSSTGIFGIAYSGVGGVTAGGLSAAIAVIGYTGIGGLKVSGSSGYSIQLAAISSGGVSASGTASYLVTFSFLATGNLTVSGYGIPLLSFYQSCGGGVYVSGSANNSIGFKNYSTGSIVVSGTSKAFSANLYFQYYSSYAKPAVGGIPLVRRNQQITNLPIGRFISTSTGQEVTAGVVAATFYSGGNSGPITGLASYNSSGGTWVWNTIDASVMNSELVGLSFTLQGCIPIFHLLSTEVNTYVSSQVSSGLINTTSFAGDSLLSTQAGFYAGSVLLFTSGNLSGISRRITNYDGITKTFTFATSWPSIPSLQDQFIIMGRIE